MSLRMSSPTEEAWLFERRLMPLDELHDLFRKEFNRPEITKRTIVTIRKRIGASKKQGVDNKYPPGHYLNSFGYWVMEIPSERGRPKQIMKHRFEWEKVNGPVPKNQTLVCLGDKKDCRPENWASVPRDVAPYLKRGQLKLSDIPPSLWETAMALARLRKKIGLQSDGRLRVDQSTTSASR